MINGFVVVKIIAIYVGPSGLAFIGQFQNFLSILMSFATGAINSGVVKYTAEYRDDEVEKQNFGVLLFVLVWEQLFLFP